MYNSKFSCFPPPRLPPHLFLEFSWFSWGSLPQSKVFLSERLWLQFHEHFSFSCYKLRQKIAISHIWLCQPFPHIHTSEKCILSKEWQGSVTVGKVWHYPDFVRLFHTICAPLRSVELSKEWHGVRDWRKSVTYCPDFVGLFHTSTTLRSVERRKERQGVRDWEKVWLTISSVCQTIPYFHSSQKCRIWNEKKPVLDICAPRPWKLFNISACWG